MQTICIGCGCIITNGPPEAFASSGVCRNCLETQVRAIQRRQGNFDCFGKATDFCDQPRCKYRWLCFEKRKTASRRQEPFAEPLPSRA
ncbi:MAG: hypothetical protein AB1512_28160 [Thermodesulfobacteriota bacterium]